MRRFSRRFIAIALWTCLSIATAAAQGTVALYNFSRPLTAIEVGNTVEVSITGAASDGAVTQTLNGGAPYYYGQTDASGNWYVTATETSATVGNYIQRWYVNGVELNYDYTPYAPRLPYFSVYANFSGTNCSGQSMSTSACGTGKPVRTSFTNSPVLARRSSCLPYTASRMERVLHQEGCRSRTARQLYSKPRRA